MIGKRHRFATRWLPLREADRFVALHHRHHDPAQGGIVALGIWEGDDLVGVGVLGRPVSRELQRQGVCECIRLCVREGVTATGDHANCAASQLEAKLRRVAQALGFVRMVTYTLPSESGASWRGAGYQQDMSLAGGGVWTRSSRTRGDPTYPTERKVRWWAALKRQREIGL